MPQFVIAKPCPTCGSLLTYSANASDPVFSAHCFICQRVYSFKNENYAGPVVCSECGQPATLVPAPTSSESPTDTPQPLAGVDAVPEVSEPIVGQDLQPQEEGDGERAT